MEPTENTPMPANPKPSDEVQLNIETVTPETEKDVMPTKDVTGENSKDQTVNPEDSKDKQESETTETEQSESEPQQQSDKDNPAAAEINKDGGNLEDARDQIETIKP